MRDFVTGLLVFAAFAGGGILWMTYDRSAKERPTLIAFSAPWCGPCKQMSPVLDRLASEFRGRAEVVRVDISKDPELARQYGVAVVPTFVVVVKEAEVSRITGKTSYETLAGKLKS